MAKRANDVNKSEKIRQLLTGMGTLKRVPAVAAELGYSSQEEMPVPRKKE